VAGAQSTGAFRDVTEAYEVLADPKARRRHDTELDAWERRTHRRANDAGGVRAA
jgi:DnaJ-class molecular chaperone